MNRILALDMLRGYALAAIMLDHMPVGVLRGYTLANFAVFDAAELFVLLSGFLVGLVWVGIEAKQGRRAAQWRFLRRAGQVWLALMAGGAIDRSRLPLCEKPQSGTGEDGPPRVALGY